MKKITEKDKKSIPAWRKSEYFKMKPFCKVSRPKKGLIKVEGILKGSNIPITIKAKLEDWRRLRDYYMPYKPRRAELCNDLYPFMQEVLYPEKPIEGHKHFVNMMKVQAALIYNHLKKTKGLNQEKSLERTILHFSVWKEYLKFHDLGPFSFYNKSESFYVTYIEDGNKILKANNELAQSCLSSLNSLLYFFKLKGYYTEKKYFNSVYKLTRAACSELITPRTAKK
jgi:hypothetical protein